jgi:hypothetical protein
VRLLCWYVGHNTCETRKRVMANTVEMKTRRIKSFWPITFRVEKPLDWPLGVFRTSLTNYSDWKVVT